MAGHVPDHNCDGFQRGWLRGTALHWVKFGCQNYSVSAQAVGMRRGRARREGDTPYYYVVYVRT